ncbi:MAG: class I mannose-6-phosphate isomerase [Kiritimatiellae bacterium]|nr:class I mannose-6-phosphate isomerase [Kiritimatiellia bacterium]
MTTALYPLTFRPIYKDYLWGGSRIIERYHRKTTMEFCAESWEITDRKDGESVVAQGLLEGCTLHELIQEYGASLLGEAVPAANFPLLIKLIDAKESLSIQVHPNDASARESGGEAKTEAWYILDADPEASVYAGFREPVTPEVFSQSVREGHLPDLLQHIPVKKGDVIFIPGGRIHAIACGCLLLEVQQNSNTTFRVFDWNRVGKDGSPRELHIEQALRHIHWQDADSALQSPTLPQPLSDTCLCSTLLKTDYFNLNRVELTGSHTFAADASRFRVLFVEKGTMALQYERTLILQPGDVCLLPAALDDCTLAPLAGTGTCLTIIP